jgi:WD40 repeat protein
MSLALAVSSSEPLKTRPDVSLAPAFEAYRARPRPEASSAVVRALLAARGSGLRGVLHVSDSLRAVAFSPDGTTLASAGADGPFQLWATASRTRRAARGAQRHGQRGDLQPRRQPRRVRRQGRQEQYAPGIRARRSCP